MKKLLLLLLFPFICNAQLNLNQPSTPIRECDSNPNFATAKAVFDLTSMNTFILNGLDANEYAVTIHNTYTDADQGENPISDPESHTVLILQTFFVRVTQIVNTANYGIVLIDAKVEPRPYLSVIIPTQYLTDNDGDLNGSTITDLTSLNNNPSNDPLEFTYYISAEDAENKTNAIANPQNFVAATQKLYVRSDDLINGCYATRGFDVIVNSTLNINSYPDDRLVCEYNSDGIALFDLRQNSILYGLAPNAYNVKYHLTLEDAQSGSNPISQPESFINTTPNSQQIYVRVEEIANTANYAYKSFFIYVNESPIVNVPIEPLIVIDVDNNPTDDKTRVNLTLRETSILGDYNPIYYAITYFIDANSATAGAPRITNQSAFMAVNEETIYYRLEDNLTGCFFVGSFNIIILPQDYETPAPIGITEQTFTEGETLADIEIEGENIQWYDNSGEANDFIFTPKNGELPLPLTTTLVDGVTYYASQTIYNIESNNRLGVTVLKTLAVKDNQFAGMTYYPNPIKDIFTIINKNEIETVSIVNMLGQTIANEQINNTTAQIDLSSLQSGVYLVHITSDGKNKSIKVVKQ